MNTSLFDRSPRPGPTGNRRGDGGRDIAVHDDVLVVDEVDLVEVVDGSSGRLRRSWVQRGILAINLCLIGVSLLLALVLNYGYQRTASINRVALARNLTALPSDVEPGERVLNILLVGSDSSAGLDDDDPVQAGREGERFGDVIIVAHVDERTRDVALLSFPRDLWVPIAGTSSSDRINRAFVIGGPGALIDTLESEFQLPIHHYVNVDFAGFQGLVDAVGSVAVPFPEPARDWNVAAKPKPRTQTGFIVEGAGCHALDGPTALAYVRSRYYQTQNAAGEWITDPTSDFGRIQRQQDFLRRLAQTAIDRGARNPFVLNDLLDAALANVAIDEELTPQLILDLAIAFRTFEPGDLETFSIPVVDAEINGNQVLQAVESETTPILNLFKGASFDDPSTLSVTIITSERPNDLTVEAVELLQDALEDQGIQPRRSTRGTVAPGVRVVHGPDGGETADQIGLMVEETIGVTPGVDVSDGRLHTRAVEVVVEVPEPVASAEQSSPAPSPDDGASRSEPSPNAINSGGGVGEVTQTTPPFEGVPKATPNIANGPDQSDAAVQSERTDERALSC